MLRGVATAQRSVSDAVGAVEEHVLLIVRAPLDSLVELPGPHNLVQVLHRPQSPPSLWRLVAEPVGAKRHLEAATLPLERDRKSVV